MMVMMRKMTMKRMTKTRTRKTMTKHRSSTRTAKNTRRLRPGEAPEGLQESTPLTPPPPSLGAEVTGTTSG